MQRYIACCKMILCYVPVNCWQLEISLLYCYAWFIKSKLNLLILPIISVTAIIAILGSLFNHVFNVVCTKCTFLVAKVQCYCSMWRYAAKWFYALYINLFIFQVHISLSIQMDSNKSIKIHWHDLGMLSPSAPAWTLDTGMAEGLKIWGASC